MKNFETKFSAITPDGEEKKEVAPKEEEIPQEGTFALNEYIKETENSVSYLGVEVPKGEGGPLVPDRKESSGYPAKRDYFYSGRLFDSLRHRHSRGTNLCQIL